MGEDTLMEGREWRLKGARLHRASSYISVSIPCLRFNLPERTEPEVFNITRDGPSSPTASLCVTTGNHTNTYDKVEVVGVSEDGTLGSLPVPVELIEEIDNTGAFSTMCPLPVIQPGEFHPRVARNTHTCTHTHTHTHTHTNLQRKKRRA